MSYGKKSRNPGWKSGNHWVICDRSGKAVRESDSITEWDGNVVAKEEFESRHPQDFVRAVKDNQKPTGNIRVDPTNSFVDVTFCLSRSAVPNFMIPGCAIPANTTLVDLSSDDVPSGTF